MCVNGKWILNKATGKSLFVPCGHCYECQLERSDRLFSRIMNHERDTQYFRLFVTLNYSNECLPYIDFSDPDNTVDTFHVYRDCKVYYHRNRFTGVSRRIVKSGKYHVCDVHLNEYDLKRELSSDLTGLKEPQKFEHSSCIGVALSYDFKCFIKKLRQYLKRYYGLDTQGLMSYYRVSEYGPTTLRPHFHIIFYFPQEWSKYYQSIQRSIIASWPFACYEQTSQNIGIARQGQQYVSQYSVRPAEFPEFLSIRQISPKCSFSRGFGFGEDDFQPQAILEKVRTRTFTYSYQKIGKDGICTPVSLPIPKYVMSRYFPKFKGQHLLDSQSLFSVLQDVQLLSGYSSLLGYSDYKELSLYQRRIERARCRLGLSPYDYAFTYISWYSGYYSYMMHRLYDSFIPGVDSWSQWYDNKAFLLSSFLYPEVPDSIYYQVDYSILDPNAYPCRVSRANESYERYQDRMKKVKFNDYTASLQYNYIEYKLKKRSYEKNSAKSQRKSKARALSA